MRARPGVDLADALFEGAAGAVIDFRDVEDLEARLHHRRFVETGLLACGLRDRLALGMREASAFGVGEDVDLQLAHAPVELLRQGQVIIIQRGGELGIALFERGEDGRRDPLLIAVVRADHLDVVHPKGRPRRRSSGGREDRRQGEESLHQNSARMPNRIVRP